MAILINNPAPLIAARPLGQPNVLRDLYVTAVGYLPHKKEWVHHGFSMHAIGLIVSGRGTYRAGGGPIRALEPGCMFAVYPGPEFHYGARPGTAWEEYYVCLAGPGLRRWLRNGLFPCDGSVHPLLDLAPLVERCREMLRVLRRGQPGDADRATLLAEQYLLELYYHRTAGRRARTPNPSLDAVRSHCQEYFAEPLDFQALAKRNAMSYSLLRLRLKQLTGAPPAQYLARLRCEAARTLLSDTDLSVKTIAERVGMEDPYSFSRTFKKCLGLSPAHYRRQTAPWAGKK